MKRLDSVLEYLEGTPVAPLRLWLEDSLGARVVYGESSEWVPSLPLEQGLVLSPEGLRWMARVEGVDHLWIEGKANGDRASTEIRSSSQLLGRLIELDRELARLTQELASRYEEIDLLYTISEILGHTIRLEPSAQIIVRAVASVVGARRASIMVYEEEGHVLRTVACQGIPPGRAGVVAVDDPTSVAARVFRDQVPLIGDPIDGATYSSGKEERGYQGHAFMSVPISYAAPAGPSRCIGVVNLTDRIGGDRFLPSDRKLIMAIANQVGAALENARLVQREREQERLERELQLASDLQQALFPKPTSLGAGVEVGVRCVPLESVGGDFYTFARLSDGGIGIMIGDVSAHGFSAALLMASALTLSGLHLAAAEPPDVLLATLADGLAEKLASTESSITVFSGMFDRARGSLRYANAGHPHAFRIGRDGAATRLDATTAPLGLSEPLPGARSISWEAGSDLLCLWTDGLVDATNEAGEHYGEERVLRSLRARIDEHPERIVAAIMEEADRFTARPSDDRTILVLRV